MKWTLDRLKEEVNKYPNRKEFRKECKTAYTIAFSRGLLDELFKDHINNGLIHKKERKGYWTIERLQDLVNKCENRNQFTKRYRVANTVATKYKLVDELFKNHLNEGYLVYRVTMKVLHNDVNKCETRHEFRVKFNAHYSYSSVNKLLDELFKNHPNNGYSQKCHKNGYWTLVTLQEEVNKYKNRKEFIKGNKKAYLSAINKKLLNKLFENHINNGYSINVKRD